MFDIKKVAPALALLVILLMLFGGVFDVPAMAQNARQQFEWIIAKRLTVNTTADVTGNLAAAADVSVGDDITVTDDANIAGTLTLGQGANVTGNATFANPLIANGYIASTNLLYLIPADPITVTNGGTITPTTAVVELTADSSVGAALTACGDGQFTVFINTANQTITISDTGTTRLAGNAALGQWDTLTVVGSGISCNEVARANN